MATTDDPDYQRKHRKMRKQNGLASQYLCEHECGQTAEQWAQVHGKDGWDPEEDYIALCRSCHQKYDYTEERKAKIGNANRGKKRTLEQRQVLSRAHIGNTPSEETKVKLSQALKGKPWTEARRMAQKR